MIYKVVRLFVNALTADDKQHLLNRENLKQPIQIHLTQKQKTFSQFFFFVVSKSILNFEIFSKMDEPQKTSSDKSLKSRVSEDPSRDNIKNGL